MDKDDEEVGISDVNVYILVGLSVPMRIEEWPDEKKGPISPLGEIPASESEPRFMYWNGKEWIFEIAEARRFNWVKSAHYWAQKLAAQAPRKFRYLARIRIAKLDPEGTEIGVPKGPFPPAEERPLTDAERSDALRREIKAAPLGLAGKYSRPAPLANRLRNWKSFATGPIKPDGGPN